MIALSPQFIEIGLGVTLFTLMVLVLVFLILVAERKGKRPVRTDD